MIIHFVKESQEDEVVHMVTFCCAKHVFDGNSCYQVVVGKTVIFAKINLYIFSDRGFPVENCPKWARIKICQHSKRGWVGPRQVFLIQNLRSKQLQLELVLKIIGLSPKTLFQVNLH